MKVASGYKSKRSGGGARLTEKGRKWKGKEEKRTLCCGCAARNNEMNVCIYFVRPPQPRSHELFSETIINVFLEDA